MKDDHIYLLHIHDEILFLEETFPDLTFEMLCSDKKSQHIAQKSLEIIGEASKKLSDEMKSTHPEIPWRLITGMRDKLTHCYFDVSWEAVWHALRVDIPQLKPAIELMLLQIR